MGKQKHKVNPERRRAHFSKEFKVEAVLLLKLGQKPATQLSPWNSVSRATSSTSGRCSFRCRGHRTPSVAPDTSLWTNKAKSNA